MRSTSVFTQVSLLSFASVLIAFGLSFGAVLLTPVPPPPQISIRDVITAFKRDVTTGFIVEKHALPPAGLRLSPIETALSRALSISPDRIQVDLIDTACTGHVFGEGQSTLLIGQRLAIIDSNEQGFTMRWDEHSPIGPDTRLPAFVAALRQEDGRWLWIRPTDPGLTIWRLRLLLAFGLALALLSGPVWYATRCLTRPIEKLGTAARHASIEGARPFPVTGPKEVQEVATAMNTMHDRLSLQSREQIQALTALAHDMRTPLTGLRIRAELIPSGQKQYVLDDVARMTHMIEDVLAFARLSQEEADFQITSIIPLLREITASHRALGEPVFCEDNDTHWNNIVVRGEAIMIRRAIENVIVNALRYAGSARLTISCPGNQPYLKIHIDDDGPGVSTDKLDFITRPFTRLESSRNRSTGGTGLGLAITKRIVTGYGGQIELRNRLPKGLRITLSFQREEL
ncbi:two-component system sensor histidine kinase [Gluconobacter japonicus]|nr:two-component system sensor histidine kinase [Gluconobacter japonicus]